MKPKISPLRMCVMCRDRLSQSSLWRLQNVQGRVVNYNAFARSFYVCDGCIGKTSALHKRLKKLFKNQHLTLDFNLTKELKATNG